MRKDLPEWFDLEAARAEEQAASGQAVNKDASGGPVKLLKRINKAFQVEEGRVAKWHLLVAMEKGKGRGHKSGPELIDEALDLLFEQYQA
ncbi:hypothetical protein [Rhodopirellula europaea]|uniref:hypothetical protein n=1 Tax=Rhodopirellula europaea TaxID=1263866 RepID=UPI003D29AD0C